MNNLKDKVAIVTGGERGIGRAIVERLLDEGMRVCIAGIDTNSADALLRELDAGDRLLFQETDVRDEPAVRGAVAATVAAFGRLDAMVANAGLPSPGNFPVEETPLEFWNNVLAVNLTGCFLAAKHAFPELRRTGGAMVLIASIRALQSEPDTLAYSASKGGVLALTHSLAISGGPQVRVNAVSPGWIHTRDRSLLKERHHAAHPVGRVGMPVDIAGMTAFLLSGDAAFITGQNFVVDGGISRRVRF